MVLILTCITFLSCTSSSDKTGYSKPNIVIILADDMGYGDVSSLNLEGRTQTPAIDKLVNEGINFTNAHASASVCTPSRYGLLTGRYAFRTSAAAKGIWGFDKTVIDRGRTTIASMLQNAGYTTAIVGKWHLGLDWQTNDGSDQAYLNEESGYSNVDYTQAVNTGPNDFGFDYSFIHPASLDIPPYMFLRNHRVIDDDIILTTDHYQMGKDNTVFSWDKKHTNNSAVYWEKGVWWRQGEMSRSFRLENAHSTILEEGLDYIENQANDSHVPFFLYLTLTGPHTPWMPTDKFKDRSPIGLYGDFILDIDDVVDQVYKTLADNNLQENTILIFASDNGAYWPQEEIELHDHDSNQGRRGQKGDIWDGGHRIPFVVSWPDQIDKNSEYSHLISLTDVFSTIAELTGHSMDDAEAGDSFSFLPVIYGETDRPIRKSMVHHSSRGMYSIRRDGWKLIDGLGSGGFTEPYFIEPQEDGISGQLFRVESDKLESKNLFLQHPDKVTELQDLLEFFKGTPEKNLRYGLAE
ncbi:MAG: arylsulfatase [Balneolales bacterium]